MVQNEIERNVKAWKRVKIAQTVLPYIFVFLIAAVAANYILEAETVCLSSGSQACRIWRGFQWETIAAGFLGLGGGYMALNAVKWQDKRAEQRMAKACDRDLDHLQTVLNSFFTERAVLLDSLPPILQLCDRIEAEKYVPPDTEQNLRIYVSIANKTIHRMIDTIEIIQSAARQITQDFRTVVLLINRAEINRHLNLLPLDVYRDLSKQIGKLPTYIPENDQKITLPGSISRLRQEVSLIHSTVRNNTHKEIKDANREIEIIRAYLKIYES